MAQAKSLEKMLARGRDDSLIRFSLGTAYLAQDEPDATAAARHLRVAVVHDPGYSAAWKLLGKALTATDDESAALDAYERGIEAADARGDKQAAKEMGVFARRLRKKLE
jgi:Tfp pilus assembly protein PilF